MGDSPAGRIAAWFAARDRAREADIATPSFWTDGTWHALDEDDMRAVLAEHTAMADLLGLTGEWGIRFKGTSQDFDYPMTCEQDAREALAEADGERWTLIHRKIGTWKETT